MYTQGYFAGVGTVLLPELIDAVDYRQRLESSACIYTISLDTDTRVLAEAYLTISAFIKEEVIQRDFLKYAEKLGSSFEQKCFKLAKRFSVLHEGSFLSNARILFYVIENSPFLLDGDDPLMEGLQQCVRDAIKAECKEENHLKQKVKDVVYYVKQPTEKLPEWVEPLATFINLSAEHPTEIPLSYEIFKDFPAYFGEGIPAHLALEIKKLLNFLIDQMIYSTEGYERIIKLERLSPLLQVYVESLILEHKITSVHELVIKLEEVLKC